MPYKIWFIDLSYFLLCRREEIFAFLKQQVEAKDVDKLKLLLDVMTDKELVHLDFLIYLMGYYNTAANKILETIMEILNEDEKAFLTLMSNFNVKPDGHDLISPKSSLRTDWRIFWNRQIVFE
jgi:hypothetical protein